MSAIRRVTAVVAVTLLLAGAGCASKPAARPDPGPTRTCPGCGAQVMDPNVKKCPTCDTPLGR